MLFEIEHGIVGPFGQQPETARNFLIRFDFTAEIATEAILVDFTRQIIYRGCIDNLSKPHGYNFQI